MPRGVPASGKRRPRAVFAAAPHAETAVAGSAVDGPYGTDEAVVEADAAPDFPAGSELIDPDELIGDDLLDDEPGVDQVSPEPEMQPSLPPAEPVLPGPPSQAEPVLTPEQREIKQLRDQLARVSGRKDVEPVVEQLNRPGDESNIVIHFLQDGMTALGRVFYRGEELEFEVGSQAYRDTFDRTGRSWLDLRFDEFAQVDRWGQIMFRSGPWPGKSYADGTFEALKDVSGAGSVKAPTAEELAAAEKRRQKRAAPRLPSLTQG